MADTAASGAFVSHDGLQIPTRSNRPVSWHPSSQMAPQTNYPSTYGIPRLNTQSDFHNFDLPQTPAIYSGYGSPDSNFSPVSMPYNGYEQQCSQPNFHVEYQSSNQQYAPDQDQAATSCVSSQQGNTDPAMYSHFDWSNYAPNGFEGSTSPPTPESFLPIQHPDTAIPADDTIPYHSLSESEPEGEVLQGLGLYDTPEISKAATPDPHLDNYRTLVMSQLLGTPCRKSEPESTGKGLKLEETWIPPSDDEEEDEQDGEGEDDDEPVAEQTRVADNGTTQRSYGMMDASQAVHSYQANQGLHYNGGSWL
jgi:hypothetical protein